MSVEAMTWALSVPISGNAKIILLGLANHASADMDEARPAVGTLAKYAHCDRRTVQRHLRHLESLGLIERTGWHPVHGRPDRAVSVWRLTGRHFDAATANGAAECPERGDSAVTNGAAQVTPEPSKSKPSEEPPFFSSANAVEAESRPDVDALCDLLATLIVGNDPKAKPATRSKGWRDAARLLLDSDQRPFDEATAVMRWSQGDSFWRGVVLSMPKFREKYPQLLLKMNAGPGRGSGNGPTAADFHAIARGAA